MMMMMMTMLMLMILTGMQAAGPQSVAAALGNDI